MKYLMTNVRRGGLIMKQQDVILSPAKQDQLRLLSVWYLREKMGMEPKRNRKVPITDAIHSVAKKMAKRH
jgi:hypothetical protein